MIQNLFDLYATWAYAWALIAPTSMGLAKLLYGAARELALGVTESLYFNGMAVAAWLAGNL